VGGSGDLSRAVLVAMVAKCANPACAVPFLYMREGKLFRMEFDLAPDLLKAELDGSPKAVRKVEHFWLCGPCSASLTLVMSGGRVTTVSIEPETFERAAS